MAKYIVIEEFHLTVYIPRDLPERESRAIRRTLTGARFRSKLQRAMRDHCARYPTLAQVRVVLSR